MITCIQLMIAVSEIDNHQIIWVILNYEFNEARPTIGQSDEDEKSE